MNKSVITSIQPYWVFLIIAKVMGWDIPQEKTVEVRKDYPKDKLWNKVAHIYCGKNRKSFKRIPKQYQPFMKRLLGKVIGEFVCDRIYSFILCSTDGGNADCERQYYLIGENSKIIEKFWIGSCIEPKELAQYIKEEDSCYGWHISDLIIYDKPKELGEFYQIVDNPKCEYRKKLFNFFICTEHDGTPCKWVECVKKKKPLTRPFQSWGYVQV